MINCFVTRIIQRHILKKNACSHQGRYVPLASARSMGFIVNAAEPGAEQAVKVLRKALTDHKIRYKGICLDLHKESPEEPELHSGPEMLVIGRRNINWYGLPEEAVCSEFTKEPFDILIDLTTGSDGLFTVDYILRKASAQFRIGTSGRQTCIYDMTVSGNSGDNAPDRLAKSIINYLISIHTDSK